MNSADRSIREARRFVSYARRVWPLHRRFARSHLSRRCTRCIISEAWTPIGDDGICRDCAAAGDDVGSVERAADQRDELAGILGEYQGRGRGRYDAVLLFSGGKDSIYMLHEVRERFPGLRLLALTVDNGFMSPVAMESVHEVIAKLDVDHVIYRHKASTVVSLFRYGMTHLNEDGCAGTVDFSDGELLLDTARNLSARMEIPLILCGYSRYQAEGGLGLTTIESPPRRSGKTASTCPATPLTRSSRTAITPCGGTEPTGPKTGCPDWCFHSSRGISRRTSFAMR